MKTEEHTEKKTVGKTEDEKKEKEEANKNEVGQRTGLCGEGR